MSNFYLYQGKSEIRPENVSATVFPLEKLLENPVYHDVNHIIYTDNWYTSLPSLDTVVKKGCHYVGTIKTNKKGLLFKFAKTGKGKSNRGDMKMQYCYRRGKQVYYVAWMDRKPVHILSTIKSYMTTCKRGVIHHDGS